MKTGDIVFVPISYAEHYEDEESWYIYKDRIKEVKGDYGRLEHLNLLVDKIFYTLQDAIKYLEKYLKETYSYKWKKSFLKKVINKTKIELLV